MLHGRWSLWRLRRLKNHAIVCGLGENGWPVLKALVSKGIPVVVIEQDHLNAHLGWVRNNSAYILIGNAKDMHNLVQANVVQAKYLLALTDNDTANCEIIYQGWQLK